MTISEKIAALRTLMKDNGIDAYIIPSSDPHISEYPAAHWECRQWISGFTGSAGTVAVTSNKAGLWTDSRYFLQAEEQLKGSGIDLFKDGLPDTPDIKNWLLSELPANTSIGIDGEVYAASDALTLKNFFGNHHINLKTGFKPFDSIWKNRPGIPTGKTFVLPEEFSGVSAKDKIASVLQETQSSGAEITLLASLDTIAWLFNIRGNDVVYNPVAVCYAIVSEKETILFIHPEKLTTEVIDYLKSQHIVFADYTKIFDYVKKIPSGQKILINPAKINYSLFNSISDPSDIKEVGVHPADMLKSIKNETEINGFKQALTRDGVALVHFYMWLEKALASGEKVTELDISRQLKHFRSEQTYYSGESFSTIAGYAEHGAVVHYSPTEESNATIKNKGLLLIDSGAQYFDGTTDITRTIAVGDITDQMRTDYTLVLKGHIALAQARFPQGTKGCQLDILARKALWDRGLNYLHGTGHGIGYFLNVHEGPQSIRTDLHPTPLQPGMVTSNEPGLYRAGEYGIRIENLILTVTGETTAFGSFYQFETLTLCPIDKKPIDKSLLTGNEIEWLNNYHQNVYEKISPFLNEEEKAWLKEKTAAL
ncbi:MAG: aminopeptidase P family protein [Candidatus Azobacteroides sp.]|nr:aminopeptidase P family protein [Candidatus Azobacteroides sp.]